MIKISNEVKRYKRVSFNNTYLFKLKPQWTALQELFDLKR